MRLQVACVVWAASCGSLASSLAVNDKRASDGGLASLAVGPHAGSEESNSTDGSSTDRTAHEPSAGDPDNTNAVGGPHVLDLSSTNGSDEIELIDDADTNWTQLQDSASGGKFEPPPTSAPLDSAQHKRSRLILPVPGGDSAEVDSSAFSIVVAGRAFRGPAIVPVTRWSVDEALFASPPVAVYAPQAASSSSSSSSEGSKDTDIIRAEPDAGDDDLSLYSESRRRLRS